MEGETVIRVRGGGVAAVMHLMRTKQLVFTVVDTRHHGRNLMQAALRKLADHISLRDALVLATSMECRIEFRHGTSIFINTDKDQILIGIDCDPNEAVRLI